MALTFKAVQPQPNLAWVDASGRPTLPMAQYLPLLDAVVRLLASGQVGPLVVVTPPTNANAAAAGVPIGGLYTSTANPAPVFVRTS